MLVSWIVRRRWRRARKDVSGFLSRLLASNIRRLRLKVTHLMYSDNALNIWVVLMSSERRDRCTIVLTSFCDRQMSAFRERERSKPSSLIMYLPMSFCAKRSTSSAPSTTNSERRNGSSTASVEMCSNARDCVEETPDLRQTYILAVAFPTFRCDSIHTSHIATCVYTPLSLSSSPTLAPTASSCSYTPLQLAESSRRTLLPSFPL